MSIDRIVVGDLVSVTDKSSGVLLALGEARESTRGSQRKSDYVLIPGTGIYSGNDLEIKADQGGCHHFKSIEVEALN